VTAILSVLREDRWLSEAVVMRRTRLQRPRLLEAIEPLVETGYVAVATVQHTQTRPMRIYRRVA